MLGLKNKRECVGCSRSIMIDVVATQGYCCEVEFNQSALQNEEKADSWMKKGFVEEVSLELTFRNKSSAIAGTPG